MSMHVLSSATKKFCRKLDVVHPTLVSLFVLKKTSSNLIKARLEISGRRADPVMAALIHSRSHHSRRRATAG